MIGQSLGFFLLQVSHPPATHWRRPDGEPHMGGARAQSGLVAATWMWATVLPPDTSSACSGSLRLPGSAVATPTRLKRLTLPSIPGVVRLRKVVRLTHCKLLWKLRQPPAS